MTPGANADGKRSEKSEAEDSLRTVECLRGRLLAERVASRNAKEEAEQMENKLIELEKKLGEESKSRNRAEKKLKFLMKKLESLNISYVSCESEQSGSGSLEKSEISSVVSSVASSSTKEGEDKEINANVTNFIIGDTREFIRNSKSPPDAENLQQSACSSTGNHDNLAAGETICSGSGVNLPELTTQKEGIEEFKEKSESPTVSNNSEQNASSFAKNHDNLASGETISASNDVNFPELTTQKKEIGEFEKNSESPSVSNNFEQNASSSARNHHNPAAGGTIGYSNGVDFPELTMKKEEIIEEFKMKTEAPIVSTKAEQNASPSAKIHDNPAVGETIGSRNGVDFPEMTMKNEEIDEFNVKTESPAVSFESEQNACTINRCNGSPTTQLEIYSRVEAHSAKSSEPESSHKAKKDDHSLRTLFKMEKLNEDNEQEQDDQVDNSLALVPVDLPKTKQRVDPVILDATVKEVLGALRNAKEKLQTSMERRRNNMIKVG